MLITNPRQKKPIEEFIDKDHAVMDEYYTIFDGETTREDVLKLMHKLIKRDPDFYDTYNILVDALFEEGKAKEAAALLKTAYERAVKRIADSQGRWPKLMRWGFMENRHIMRIIDRYALYCWETKNVDEALTIFRQLLKANTNDNQGVRYNILAIKMGLSSEEWEKPFEIKRDNKAMGLDAIKLEEWFESNAKKFPEEFQEPFADDGDDEVTVYH